VAEETCPEDTDLMDDCKAVAVVIKVLEERLENFATAPSSAEAQSYLLIAAKRFIEPTNRLIDSSKRALNSIEDETVYKEMKDALDETEISLNELEANVDKSESSLATLETEAAAELIKSLRDDLSKIK